MTDSPPSGRGDGLPNRTRAHRGGGRSPRAGPPGRETTAATTNYRHGWIGVGSRSGSEKTIPGKVLADIGRIAGEIGILTIPTMVYLPIAAGNSIGMFDAWIAALTTMLVVGTLLRGGWIAPPLTESPGWARLFPTLILLRVLYFNGVLLFVIHSGPPVADVTGVSVAGPLWAVVVGGIGTLLFPRTVDEWMAYNS